MIDRTRATKPERQGARIRVGAVSYLNSKPLIEGLQPLLSSRLVREGMHGELILDYPSRLADQLAAGQLDVALIPSVEALAHPDYRIVSDACVATRGPVMSVKLFCRRHPGELRTLALDEGSRTSAALVRIMLEERYGVRPAVQPLPLGRQLDDTDADAVLLIGDRAMHEPAGTFAAVWDLGSEWLQWTGLPFVFAMWVARKEVPGDIIGEVLSEARDLGCSRLAEIARREAPGLGLSDAVAQAYLEKHLHFRRGAAEQNGLTLFQELAQMLGLLPLRDELSIGGTASTLRSRPVAAAR